MVERQNRPERGDESGEADDVVDMIEPMLAVKAITASQKILAGILAISEDAIISAGQDGRIKMFNRGAREIFGYMPGEVVGEPIEMLLPEPARENHADLVRKFSGGEIPSKIMEARREIAGLRKNGERFPAEASISKIDVGGEVILTVILRDVSERKRLEGQLEEMARYDSLTGLANRAMFREMLDGSLARSRRSGTGVALLFLDLDRFKTINDTLGHRIGDLLLKEVAARLKSCLRETDIIARLGGDEFTIVTEGSFSVVAEGVSARRNAAIIAKKLIEVMAAPFQLEEHEVFANTSIGIAETISGEPDAENLLKHADMAMYRAKEKGGGTYEFHTGEMTEAANRRLDLENKIRRAVESEEFILHYQPQMDLRTGRIIGMEALARWNRPGAHLVPPNEFIPVAEETGLIVPLGEWVLRAACKQHSAWLDAGLPHARISVNISARQFQDRGLLGLVREILDSSGFEPEYLEMEVTEGLLAGNSTDTVETMQALKVMGVRLSIDDFGTGYSSLAYLKEFPVDSLKIDRSFIEGVLHNRQDAAIAGTVIELAHNLGLEVVAEGVEKEEQMAWLRERGCDIVQGFLISRPMEGDLFAEWLGAESPRQRVAVI